MMELNRAPLVPRRVPIRLQPFRRQRRTVSSYQVSAYGLTSTLNDHAERG